MARKLFCQLSPTTYRISRRKNILLRRNHARVCYDTSHLEIYEEKII